MRINPGDLTPFTGSPNNALTELLKKGVEVAGKTVKNPPQSGQLDQLANVLSEVVKSIIR